MPESVDLPPQLSYGRGRRRKPWRRLIAAVVVAVIGVAGVRCLWWLSGRRAHLRWQRQSADFVVPAGTVAYEMDATPSLDGTPPPTPHAGDPAYAHVSSSPFNGTAGLDAQYLRWPLDHYRPPSPIPFISSRSTATVFCHERTARCGARIVVVTCHLEQTTGQPFPNHFGVRPNHWSADLWFAADAITPAGLIHDEVTAAPTPSSFATVEIPQAGRLVVEIGQPNADDPSRFAIGFTNVDGKRREVAGRLADDGTVILSRPTP